MGADLKKPSSKWRVGDWIACTDTDTIRREGTQHKIERRAMETLVALAERGGDVVKRDELIAGVWGRVAVSDHSVAMVISQLRRALDDDARAPRYIETITKRGYRLIVPCGPIDARPVRIERALRGRLGPPPLPPAFMLISACLALAGIGAASALLFF